ncbi:MAG TPA: DNA polymerase III subunit chi [Gammaproteobacteria bacterium]|nr:DNA polymerase III subunit chi [Gammaproteobacteria bacterium]
MTQVDFYLLNDSQPAALPMFTCRLTEKAYRQGHQVYIQTASDRQLRQLDDLLWTFRDGSFLPHRIHTHGADIAGEQPILLGHAVEPEGPGDVLLNLAEEVPVFFSRFSRVAELVGGEDGQIAAARDRYRYYKDRGYTLNTHNL